MSDEQTRPRVSVIIPAYNAERTIGGTLSSVLTQTELAHEIIVVDDGSSDATVSVVGSHSGVTLVRQANGGVSAARNHGASVATGDVLTFFDSDDIMLPCFIERCVKAWVDHGGGRTFVFTNFYFLRARGISIFRPGLSSLPPIVDDQRMALLQMNAVNVIGGILPRDLFEEVGGFDETLPVVEDWDLAMRLVFAGCETVPVFRPTWLYRLQTGSLSSKSELMFETEERMMRAWLHNPRIQLNQNERNYLLRRLEEGSPNRLRSHGDVLLSQGDPKLAGEAYRRALGLAPRDIKLRLRAMTVGRVPGAPTLFRGLDSRSKRLNVRGTQSS